MKHTNIDGPVCLDPRTPNYDIDPREIPHYFDLESGELIVGEKARLETIRGDANSETIHALGALLIDSEFEIDQQRYQRLDVGSWSLETYKKFGRWLNNLVTPPEATRSNIKYDMINRANYLGLGPGVNRVVEKRRFGKLSGFIEALDLVPNRKYGRYEDWPHEQLVQYVVDTYLAVEPGERFHDVLTARYHANEGPRPDWMTENVGTPRSLLAERGYVDTEAWKGTDSSLLWGDAFMLANAGNVPQGRHYQQLSPLDASPSLRYIMTYHDSVKKFGRQITERYPKALEAMQERVATYTKRLERHDATSALRQLATTESLPLWLRARVSAQFLLLRAVYPDLPEHQETAIATCVRQNDYLKLVSSRLDPAAAASLRETARALGLEQDVWPTFNYEFLQVYNPDLAIPTRGESLYLTPNGLRPTPMEVEPETPVLIPEYVKASEHVEEARRIPKNESRQRLLRYLLGGGERAFEIEDIVLIPGILTELSALTDEGIAERRAELHKLYDRALEIWDIILNEVYTLKRFRHPQAACRLPGNPTRQQVRKRLTRLHPDTVDPRNEATEKFCTNCKAKRACLQFALDNKIKTGIWGGLSPRGRADLRRK